MDYDDSLCNLCPRHCNVKRGDKNFCKVDGGIYVSKVMLHKWEEPIISGSNGSGTVFFSSCNMACVFCQNFKISQAEKIHGKKVSEQRLYDIFFELQEKGAHNINLVSPMHMALSIKEVIKKAKNDGLSIPFVYNTNSYEKVEVLRELEGLIDVYLADLKYFDDTYAIKYSKSKDYFKYASKAVDEMFRQSGRFLLKDGLIKKGLIIRILLLPGLFFDARKLLKHIYDSYKDDVFISLMNQYSPFYKACEYKNINRELKDFEYERLVDYAIELGIKNAFIQEKKDEKNYTPNFDLDGV